MSSNNVLDNSPSTNPLDNAVSQVNGIISTQKVAKFLSGARCILRVNGRLVGFANSISWRINTNVTEIRTIDDYMPYELAPSTIEVRGSIGGFRIPGAGPTGDQIQAQMLSFLHQRYIEIEVRDAQTDNKIFHTKRALVTGRSEAINSDSLATMSLDFMSIGFVDEVAPEKPAGADTNDPVDPNGSRTPLGRLVDNIRGLFN
jgi:hypothetical protein